MADSFKERGAFSEKIGSIMIPQLITSKDKPFLRENHHECKINFAIAATFILERMINDVKNFRLFMVRANICTWLKKTRSFIFGTTRANVISWNSEFFGIPIKRTTAHLNHNCENRRVTSLPVYICSSVSLLKGQWLI